MLKVLDKALENRIDEILAGSEGAEADPAHEIVTHLRNLQDANGIKICMNVTVGDVANRGI